MALRPISVTQLNEYIGRVLQTDPLLGNVSVTGEISNLKYHRTGHVYFSIVDEASKINCFLPASVASKLSYTLGDGLEIILRGYINVYKKGGTYTLFVRSVEVSGDGSLAACFALLKEKLAKEGLFDPARKKKIPAFPRKIGVITAETGAAVTDIVKIIKNRTKLVDVVIFPVQVQGQGAAQDIGRMIDFVNCHFDDIDTLIVGRGGGSMEDLWAFNEEVVARAIFNSRIPVISAVGHEIDFTIADFVADMRAETPTAAAEMAVPDSKELAERIKWYKEQLLTQLQNKEKYYTILVEKYRKDMENHLEKRITAEKHRIQTLQLLLTENRPEKILSKGYSILETRSKKVVSSVTDLNEGEVYRLRLKDGTATFKLCELTKAGEDNDL